MPKKISLECVHNFATCLEHSDQLEKVHAEHVKIRCYTYKNTSQSSTWYRVYAMLVVLIVTILGGKFFQ